MKAGLISIAALSAVALAQPHQHQRHRHAKKQAVEYVETTQVTYVTATAPAAMVYVDSNGNPVSTSYGSQAAPTPEAYNPPPPPPAYQAPSEEAPAPVAPAATSQAPPPPPPAYTPPAPAPSSEAPPPPPAYSAPAPSSSPAPPPPAYSPPASSSAAPKPSSAPSAPSSGGHGISYSPYNSDNTCKSQDQVNMDFEQLSGYSMVRIYGVDCDQATTVVSAAKAKGMKVFAGLFDINTVEDQIKTLAKGVNGDWSVIDTVSVGNEGVNAGTYTVPEVAAAVKAAKDFLGDAGYHGPVVTVDTFVAVIAHPDLCNVGDYVAVNCHAFFDGGVAADKAGQFVLDQAQRVSQACGGKNTMITETGWPSQGSSNKDAVPSVENQAVAIKSLKDTFSDNIILFTAFNDYWKQNNAATFNAEQYWGIYGNCPSEKR